MIPMLKSIFGLEDKFDQSTRRFVFHHAHLAFLPMIIALPLIILTVVAIFTTMVAWLISLIFGCC